MIVSRFIYKFVYKFTREEMESWRAGIKKELGSDYFIYWLYITLNNITAYGILLLGIVLAINILGSMPTGIVTVIECQYDIVGV